MERGTLREWLFCASCMLAFICIGGVASARADGDVSAVVAARGTGQTSDRAAAAVVRPLQVRRSGRTGEVAAVSGGVVDPLFDPTRDRALLAAGSSVRPISIALRRIAPVYGIAEPDRELVLDRSETDGLGWTHHTFSQFYRGVPVFSAVLKLHEDPAGRITHANGDYHAIPDRVEIVPLFSGEKAAGRALQASGVVGGRVVRNALSIVDPGWYGNVSTGPRLAHQIVVSDPSGGPSQWFFIDARGGEILDQWSQSCTLMNRRVDTGGGGSALPGTPARSEGQGPIGDSEVDKAFDFAADTYHFYERAFGRDSIDGAGGSIVLTVHSSAPGCPNALWNDTLMQAVFCENVVADDVVAHEITHGLTQLTAALIYQNQSGQINESMSDIFGELVDLYNGNAAFAGTPGGVPWPDPSSSGSGRDTSNDMRSASGCSSGPTYANGVRWLIGEDATAFTAGVIRDMWSPTCRNNPDRTRSTLQTCNVLDSGGVHSGSGVMNHAFAMTVDGKSFNGYTVVGIGPIKAGAIWYRALTVYLTPASDYGDAYAALNQSAADLIGTFPNDPRTGLPSNSMLTAQDAAELNKALLAVEMDQQGQCGWTDEVVDVTSEPLCAARTTVFADDFEGGTNGWTVSNAAPTPYDWVQITGHLPGNRIGSVWYCADPRIGNCTSGSEAGVHTLFTPPIVIPDGGVPMLTFEHFMAVEGGWDGGNLKIRVNGGSWQSFPRSAFVHGPYNGRLRTAAQTNTNPMAGETAFIGAGGNWGRCILDLSAVAQAGDTVEVRFDFGKDCAFGFDGWYIDDLELFLCPDCNANGVADQREQLYTYATEPLGNIGTGAPCSFTLAAPPQASGNVTLTFNAMGDLLSANEFLNIYLNNALIGSVYRSGGADCPNTPDRESLTIPATTFNSLIGAGNGQIDMIASVDVDPLISQCRSVTYVQCWVRYPTALATCPANPRIYVNAAATGANDGSSWANAYRSVQSALVAATCCNTEIWVAAGTYFPGPVGAPRTTTFSLRNSVALYGGFVGNETTRGARDPIANPTILSGDLKSDDIPGFLNREENVHHVVTARGVNSSAVLDGFVVRGGNADADIVGGTIDDQFGGGMTMRDASPTVANCVFEVNSACTGGAAHGFNSDVTFMNCRFDGNQARCDSGGAAVALDGGSFVFHNATFTDNSANGGGGAAYLGGGALWLDNSTLARNSAKVGGAVRISNGALVISKCVIDSNTASIGGGAIGVLGGAAQIYNSQIVGNRSVNGEAGGGAMWVAGGSAMLANCILNGNSDTATEHPAGAVLVDSGTTTIVNATIYANLVAGASGGALRARNIAAPDVHISNSIAWGNGADPLWVDEGAPPIVVSYSDVQGGYAGTSVSSSDPQFVDPLGADLAPGTLDDDLRLRGVSACIDAGDNEALVADAPDLNANNNVSEATPLDCGGAARQVDDCGTVDAGIGTAPVVDLGALEYAGSTGPTVSQQPVGVQVCVAQPIVLQVVAHSDAHVTYQWRHGGAVIDGAMSATFEIASAALGDAGDYDVVITSGCGVVTSSTVSVGVDAPPVILQDPVGVTVCAGQPVALSVDASLPSGCVVQWRRNEAAIPGANSLTYEIVSAAVADAGQYDVQLTSVCGVVTSGAASVIVQTPPGILTQPTARSACAGGVLELEVVADGDPAPTYQWRRDGVPLADDESVSGSSTNTLTIQPADEMSAGDYDVVIENACGVVTSEIASLSIVVANEILQQPVGATVCSGATVSFAVTGTFSADTVFMWRRGGEAIAGANAATYAIAAATSADAGDYDVVITNACGTVQSDVATLIVNTPPSFALHPQSTALCDGATATFVVAVAGTPAPTIQWRRNGDPLVDGGAIGGATTATLTIQPATTADAGAYDAVLTNECGSVTSSAATLDIATPIVILQQPQSVTTCAGQVAIFEVSGSFSGGTSFQWRRDEIDVPGATSAQLSISNVTLADAGAYRVRVSNPCGTVDSDIAMLAVQSSPTVSQPLEPRLGCAGTTVQLSVQADGAPTPAYEWRRNGMPLADGGAFAGTATATLVISPFAGDTAGSYAVIVTNVCGEVESSAPAVLVLTGDANCDGNVNNFDIDFFVAGVLHVGEIDAPSSYVTSGASQACWNERNCWGDLDHSGALNNFDIDGFVACILSAPPLGEGCP